MRIAYILPDDSDVIPEDGVLLPVGALVTIYPQAPTVDGEQKFIVASISAVLSTYPTKTVQSTYMHLEPVDERRE